MLLGKWDGAILHDLLLTEKLDFRHGFDHLGFHAHDLEPVGGNPGSSLQADGIELISQFVAVHAAGTIIALPEMHHPGCLSAPIPKTLTGHVEVVPHNRMEDEGECDKAVAGNLVGIFGQGEFIGAEFVDRKKSWLGLGDGSYVVVFPGFGANGNAVLVEGLMK